MHRLPVDSPKEFFYSQGNIVHIEDINSTENEFCFLVVGKSFVWTKRFQVNNIQGKQNADTHKNIYLPIKEAMWESGNLDVFVTNVSADEKEGHSFKEAVTFVGYDDSQSRIQVPVMPEASVWASLESTAGSRWRAVGHGTLSLPVTWTLGMEVQLWKDGSFKVNSSKTSYNANSISHYTKYEIGTSSSQFGAKATFSGTDDSGRLVGIIEDTYGNF